MSYTQLAVLGVLVVIALDLFVFRTRLLRRRAFWAAYAIVVFFQLVTNGVLTGLRIVRYDFHVDAVEPVQRPDGQFEVRLRVTARKVRSDGRGNETPLDFREAIPVALLSDDGSTLYEKKHILHSGTNTLILPQLGAELRFSAFPFGVEKVKVQ